MFFEVDKVLRLTLAGEAQELRDLVVFTMRECVPDSGDLHGQPICEAGEAPGTSVEVFLSADCETFWARPGAVDAIVEGIIASEPLVYAVYIPEQPLVEGARFTAMLTALQSGGQEVAVSLGIRDGGLAAVLYHCASPPAEALAATADTSIFLLPPPGPRSVPPTWTPETRTGINGVDRVIEVMLSGDDEALVDLVVLTTLPCGTISGITALPVCPSDQPRGTPVDVFPKVSCELTYFTEARMERIVPSFNDGPLGLYAVHPLAAEKRPDTAGFGQLGQWVILFQTLETYGADEGARSGRAKRGLAIVVTAEGRISGEKSVCGSPGPEYLAFFDPSEFILPPLRGLTQ